jgi:hypothetical protein
MKIDSLGGLTLAPAGPFFVDVTVSALMRRTVRKRVLFAGIELMFLFSTILLSCAGPPGIYLS